MLKVRTRFAPSPTGKLHLGGIHTALYCWLYAKRFNGEFILRIEDTDRERSTRENIDVILNGMKWIGLDWDEGPFLQSDRMELYKKAIDKCLEAGHAYRCNCNPEEIAVKREQAIADKRTYLYDRTCREKNLGPDCGSHVIRFKMPNEGVTIIDDLIQGEVEYPNSEMDDWIIARNDGSPTYNFCVVIDDADMKISHVIRGDDHLNNTPKQLHVYKALGYETPRFAHMPLMHGNDGTKLSKRHGATSIVEYEKQGFLPGAVRNYLARLGWSHGDQEIFNDEEMIRHFDIEDIGKSASILDPEKFLWVNSQHMKNMPTEKLAVHLMPFMKERGYQIEEGPWLNKLITVFVERARSLVELADICSYVFNDDIEYEEKPAKKFLRPVVLDPMIVLRESLANLESLNEQNLAEVFTVTCEKFEIKLGKIAQPVRVAATGGSASPGIFETLELIGKDKVIKRIDKAIEFIRKRSEQQQ